MQIPLSKEPIFTKEMRTISNHLNNQTEVTSDNKLITNND